MKRVLPLLFFSLLYWPPLAAQEAIINYNNRFLPVFARQGMLVGPEKLATEAGAAILRAGGNAVDAAVATGFALAVTYPQAGNLGGGGFMLIHLAQGDRQTLIDYRETAPARAHRDLFLDEHGETDQQRERFSHQAAGVPGTVAGLLLALEKYGTMNLSQVIQPAIDLACEGFPVSFALDYALARRQQKLQEDPEARRIFFREDGSLHPVGSTFQQAELAWTLQQIQQRGRSGFYRGEVARRIVASMAANDGLISHGDLEAYSALEREPLRGAYRDFDIVTTPPPSSGGIHVLQILNIMEGYDTRAWGHNSAVYLHHLGEAMKLAYADRSRYLGDPAYSEVPVAQLIDKRYAARLRSRIDPNLATPSAQIQPGAALLPESEDTTHFSVADRFGNLVSNTYTLNFSFGSHIVAPGTGMLLNNEMADFASRPGLPNAYQLVEGEANSIEAGKRPLSSMTPTMVFRDGKPWLATGSPGGSTIITTVLQTILNAMDFDMNIATAASSVRVHHQWLPDSLVVEQGLSPDTIPLLEQRGHTVVRSPRTLGRTQSILLDQGLMQGATDSRRLGGWVAVY